MSWMHVVLAAADLDGISIPDTTVCQGRERVDHNFSDTQTKNKEKNADFSAVCEPRGRTRHQAIKDFSNAQHGCFQRVNG